MKTLGLEYPEIYISSAEGTVEWNFITVQNTFLFIGRRYVDGCHQIIESYVT